MPKSVDRAGDNFRKPDTNWWVITGAPSSGTTALANHLARRGYFTVPEAARAVIDEGFSQGKTIEQIRSDERAFQRAVLEEKYLTDNILPKEQLTFFVRGTAGDTAAFWPFGGGEETVTIVQGFRYAGVFRLVPPGFKEDYARTESPERASQLHFSVGNHYKLQGYEVVDIPVLPVSERADIVTKHVSENLVDLTPPGRTLHATRIVDSIQGTHPATLSVRVGSDSFIEVQGVDRVGKPSFAQVQLLSGAGGGYHPRSIAAIWRLGEAMKKDNQDPASPSRYRPGRNNR